MADLSRKTASIYINHAPAEEALKKLQAAGDKLTASIKKGQDAGKAMVGELAKLNKNKEDIAGLQRQIDSGLKPSFNQLQSIVAKTRAELKKMSESDPGFAQKAKDLNKYSTEMSRLGQQIGAVKKEEGGLKGMLGNMIPVLGLAAAGAALTGFLKGAVTEALESDKALGKFKGTLDNLGKGEGFDRLAEKAENMARRFKFLDSPDIISVFDKLITYGKLTEAQIDKLTPVIIDFSVKSKISLDESASVIIKALEGNGKALKEYGVNIKDAKTESERLGIIMDELGGKVRGAADAFGETTAGKIAITEQSIRDLKEEIGTGLLPVLKGALEFVQNVILGMKAAFQTSTEGLRAARGQLTESQQQGVFAEKIATEMGQKTIADQQRIADGYKSIFLTSQKALSDFMKSGASGNKKERDRLLANQEQDQKIYLATQRTLLESIEVAKNNSEKKINKTSKNNNDSAAKAREAAMRKAMADAEKLQKIWEDLANRINDPFALQAADPVAQAFKKANDQAKKDTDAAKMLLDKKVIDYKAYSDSIVRIEEIRMKALKDIVVKYKIGNTKDNYMPGRAITAGPLATGGIVGKPQDFSKDQAKLFRDGLAKQELAYITNHGKKKLQAELNILELQKKREIANKDLTENEKFLIEETYRQRRSDAEKNHNLEVAQFVVDSVGQLAQIYQLFSAGSQAADQEKLNQNQRNYDEDKNKLDRQLRQKVLSQKEYDRQIKALDEKKRKEDAAIKRKEFERNKQAQIIDAIMGGANAVISALKAPWPLNFIMAAIATGMVTAQIATITSQKAPQYGQGGLLDGPRHSSGGMPVINPTTGKKVMEVEGGEPILSRRTYANNRSLVDQLLHASLYGNGSRITPYFENRSYKRLNYSGVTQSMDRIKHFENGGILPGGNTSVVNNINDSAFQGAMMLSIDNLNNTVNALEVRLSQPFKAYTLLSELNAVQDTMDLIRKETTITRKS